MVIRAAKVEARRPRARRSQLHPRGGESKLSPFRDGWRHLRLILVYSPNALFVIPGCVLVALGALMELTVFAHLSFFGRTWYIHTLIAGAALVIVGAQVVGSRALRPRLRRLRHRRAATRWFERIGRPLPTRARAARRRWRSFSAASRSAASIVADWASQRASARSARNALAIVALTLVVVGIQVFFTSFLISLLGLRRVR